MPELPEVETVKRGLQNHIIDKKIIDVEIIDSKPIKTNLSSFKNSLKNKKVISVERVGKLLMLELSDENYLLVHLKMTGQLMYRFGRKLIAGGHDLPHLKPEELPLKYTWVIWKFSDGSKMFFNDMRKFGYIKHVDKKEKEKIEAAYGPEPLSKKFTSEVLKNILEKKQAPVKAVLMNQKRIAGIGNIYADEACFDSGISPIRKAGSLDAEEIKKLHKSIQRILEKAIEYKGTTFKDYKDIHGTKGNFSTFLRVYKREGDHCMRCHKGIIVVSKLGGRGTRYCKNCQK